MTHKSSTRKTLFQLAFVIEAIILVKVELPNLKMAYYDQSINDKQLRMNLDLIKEVGNKVMTKEESYKKKRS